METVIDRVFEGEFMFRQSTGRKPARVFLSPQLCQQAISEVARATDAPAAWKENRAFGLDVMRLDWFEDATLTGESMRFEADHDIDRFHDDGGPVPPESDL